jgi:hypothetical protein
MGQLHTTHTWPRPEQPPAHVCQALWGSPAQAHNRHPLLLLLLLLLLLGPAGPQEACCDAVEGDVAGM